MDLSATDGHGQEGGHVTTWGWFTQRRCLPCWLQDDCLDTWKYEDALLTRMSHTHKHNAGSVWALHALANTTLCGYAIRCHVEAGLTRDRRKYR